NDMRRVGGHAALGENSAGSDPSSGSPHHFDDAARAVIGGHAADVDAELHHCRGSIFDNGPISGATIRVGQIVIDGFGHTDYAEIIAAFSCFLMNLVGSVLRIV